MLLGASALVEHAGVEPGPELREAERAILAHAGSTLGESPRDGTRVHPVVGPWSPMIGRSAELATIQASLAAGDAFVVIAGEAGVGKSTLLRVVLAEQRASGVAVGLGPAASGPTATLTALSDVLTGSTRRSVLDALPRRIGQAELEVFHRSLRRRDGRRQLVAIDDAHWLDDDELSVIQHIAALAGPGMCLFLPPHGGRQRAGVRDWLDGLAADDRAVARVELGPFQRHELVELVYRGRCAGGRRRGGGRRRAATNGWPSVLRQRAAAFRHGRGVGSPPIRLAR